MCRKSICSELSGKTKCSLYGDQPDRDYFLTDGKSESIGNQTDEESVKAISDGEDIGFTEEPMPEEETEQKTEQKTENSAKQFLMIILTLPAVCILVAAIIFAIRKNADKRQWKGKQST